MYVRMQGRSRLWASSSIAFPFIFWDMVLSKPRTHRLNSKDPLVSPLPSLVLWLQVCTILPDTLCLQSRLLTYWASFLTPTLNTLLSDLLRLFYVYECYVWAPSACLLLLVAGGGRWIPCNWESWVWAIMVLWTKPKSSGRIVRDLSSWVISPAPWTLLKRCKCYFFKPLKNQLWF